MIRGCGLGISACGAYMILREMVVLKFLLKSNPEAGTLK